MRIAVVGASGYVGGRLTERLVAAEHEAVVIGRALERLPAGAGIHPVAADAADVTAMTAALAGCQAAYYLVHSMAGPDFIERDRELARTFRRAAAAAGVTRIIYLGGLGQDDLSSHLASRQEVGSLLADGPTPVVELRAAVVIGSGSVSFEMLRYLTERLPAMVCPRWVRTRIQPIAEQDLLAHLVRALDPDVPPGAYDIGGPEVTTYEGMIAAYARVRGLPKRRLIDVGFLTPKLSAHWVDLVTPVDRSISHSLIDSLTVEVVANDRARTVATFGIEGLPVDAAIRAALDDQAARLPDRLFALSTGVDEGVFVMTEQAPVDPGSVATARAQLRDCGGDLGWYGLAPAWRARIAIGRPFGERLRLHRPPVVELGAEVDWWTVESLGPEHIVLGTRKWFCGEAWLGYRLIERDGATQLEQVGALRSKGLLGVVYWRLVWPIHLVVFEVMTRRRAGSPRRRRRS